MLSMTTLAETQDEDFHRLSILNRIFREPKSFWDSLTQVEQQSSIQRNISVKIGSKTGWDVCGVVQQQWNNFFYPSIRTELDAKKAKIFQNGGTEVPYAVHLYMVGTIERYRPTIVAICYVLDIAKRVIKLARKHLDGQLKGHGFLLLAFHHRIMPNTGGDTTMPHFQNMCGVPIRLKYVVGRIETERTATIGGCLRVGSQYFGLTVGHSLPRDSHQTPQTESGISAPVAEVWDAESDISELSASDEDEIITPASSSPSTAR